MPYNASNTIVHSFDCFYTYVALKKLQQISMQTTGFSEPFLQMLHTVTSCSLSTIQTFKQIQVLLDLDVLHCLHSHYIK